MATGPGVHLIRSVPLADAGTVFRTVAGALGPWLSRIPDGETGERRRWIYFQRLMLERHPAMEPDLTTPPFALRQWDGTLLREMTLLAKFRPAVDPGSVTFETGYAAAARASYAIFCALRDAGAIPAGVRFQVCLPTPMASAYMYVSRGARDAYLPGLRARSRAGPSGHRVGHPCRRPGDPVGRLPGSAGPRGLLPGPARGGTRPRSPARWRGSVTPCPKRSRWAITSATDRPRTSISSCRATRPSWSDIANGVRRESNKNTAHRLPARAGSQGPHRRAVLPAARRSEGIRRRDALPGADSPRRPRRRPRAHPRGAGGDSGLRRVLGVRLGSHPASRAASPLFSRVTAPRRSTSPSPPERGRLGAGLPDDAPAHHPDGVAGDVG